MQERTKLWYLKNVDIFSQLRDEEYKMIDAYTRMREVKKGEILYFQGDADRNFYILKKGAVKITKLTSSGKEIILDIVKGVSIFGEMAAVAPEERDESAEVIEDGLICTMKKEDFDRLVQTAPGLSVRMTKMIGLRRWKLENRLFDLLFSTVEQRLAKTLLGLLDDFGIPREGGYLIKIKLSHRDYADLVASTRETVTATFAKLRKDGIIEFEGKYIIIKAADKLRVVAGNG